MERECMEVKEPHKSSKAGVELKKGGEGGISHETTYVGKT